MHHLYCVLTCVHCLVLFVVHYAFLFAAHWYSDFALATSFSGRMYISHRLIGLHDIGYGSWMYMYPALHHKAWFESINSLKMLIDSGLVFVSFALGSVRSWKRKQKFRLLKANSDSLKCEWHNITEFNHIHHHLLCIISCCFFFSCILFLYLYDYKNINITTIILGWISPLKSRWREHMCVIFERSPIYVLLTGTHFDFSVNKTGKGWEFIHFFQLSLCLQTQNVCFVFFWSWAHLQYLPSVTSAN